MHRPSLEPSVAFERAETLPLIQLADSVGAESRDFLELLSDEPRLLAWRWAREHGRFTLYGGRGGSLRDLFAEPGDPHSFVARFLDSALMAGQGSGRKFDVWLPAGTDQPRPWCRVKVMSRTAEGEPLALIGLIGEGRAASDVDLDALQTRFVANISHEIRTPINGILGMIELALDTGPANELANYLQVMRSSAVSLLRVLNDVLLFSKAKHSSLAIEQSGFNPREICQEVATLFAVDAFKKGLDLTCAVTPEVPTLLAGDVGRIRQVLINLTGNAVKFTAQGAVSLMIDIASEGEQRVLKFSVTDTGAGIPAGQLDGIFEPFKQADNSSTRRFGGVGLGLSICKLLVDAMGGRIAVVSREGKGSFFSFTVPLAPAADAAANALPVPEGVRAPISGAAALVVSTSSYVQANLRKYLEALGYTVELASTLEAGLALLGRHPFRFWFVGGDFPRDALALALRRAGDRSAAERPVRVLLSDVLRFSADSASQRDLGFDAVLCRPFLDQQLHQIMVMAQGAPLEKDGEGEFVIDIDLGALESNLRAANVRRRVLVVDDDPVNREVLASALARHGYDVDTAENGEFALACFDEARYDVIIMDMHMPVMDGIATTEAMRLREMRRSWAFSSGANTTPILGLTADIQEEVQAAAREAGMDAVLTKPITRSDLLRAIEGVLSDPVR